MPGLTLLLVWSKKKLIQRMKKCFCFSCPYELKKLFASFGYSSELEVSKFPCNRHSSVTIMQTTVILSKRCEGIKWESLGTCLS